MRGSKNAVPKLMVAALLTEQAVTIRNVSFVRDIGVVADLTEALGSTTTADFVEQARIVREALAGQGRDPASFRVAKRVYLGVDDDAQRARQRTADALHDLYDYFGIPGIERVAVAGRPDDVARELAGIAAAGAGLILLNPLFFALLDRFLEKSKASAPDDAAKKETAREPLPVTALKDHVVLVGHGRVGGVIGPALRGLSVPYLVIEDDADRAKALREKGVETLAANGADPQTVRAANLAAARCLLVAIPDAFEGGQVVQQARAVNPGLRIVARAHSEAEILHLMKHGASLVVMGEHEIAVAMANHVT